MEIKQVKFGQSVKLGRNVFNELTSVTFDHDSYRGLVGKYDPKEQLLHIKNEREDRYYLVPITNIRFMEVRDTQKDTRRVSQKKPSNPEK